MSNTATEMQSRVSSIDSFTSNIQQLNCYTVLQLLFYLNFMERYQKLREERMHEKKEEGIRSKIIVGAKREKYMFKIVTIS